MSGLHLSEMDVSDMLDVLHFIMEEDMLSAQSGEHLEAKEKVRTVIYKEFYEQDYVFLRNSSKSYIVEEPLNDIDTSGITPFDPKKEPTKPYVPPTQVNPDAAQPFGKNIDAPLG
jgi:hypothetical protein